MQSAPADPEKRAGQRRESRTGPAGACKNQGRRGVRRMTKKKMAMDLHING